MTNFIYKYRTAILLAIGIISLIAILLGCIGFLFSMGYVPLGIGLIVHQHMNNLWVNFVLLLSGTVVMSLCILLFLWDRK
jgi:hypothetical protein